MKKYTQYFISGTRNNGASYLYLSDTAPVELGEFVREVHMEFNCMPNDWIYKQILNALESDEPDLCEAFIEPDIYNCDLIEWTKNTIALEFLDQAIEEGHEFKGYIALVQWAQYEAIRRIYDLVAYFLHEHNEEEAE